MVCPRAHHKPHILSPNHSLSFNLSFNLKALSLIIHNQTHVCKENSLILGVVKHKPH